jgi:hypothetical protein
MADVQRAVPVAGAEGLLDLHAVGEAVDGLALGAAEKDHFHLRPGGHRDGPGHGLVGAEHEGDALPRPIDGHGRAAAVDLVAGARVPFVEGHGVQLALVVRRAPLLGVFGAGETRQRQQPQDDSTLHGHTPRTLRRAAGELLSIAAAYPERQRPTTLP